MMRCLSNLCFVFAILFPIVSACAAEPQLARVDDFKDMFAGGEKATYVYKTIGDVALKINLYLPKDHKPTDRRPAIVFFFGGGWVGGSSGQFTPQAEYLASRGMVAATVDYRIRSKHGTTPFECVADGKSAVRWLRTNAAKMGIDPNRIAAGGGSAGGHVASATGTLPGLDEPNEDKSVSSKPNALCLFNPVFDNGPGGWGHGAVGDRYGEISPMHNIRKGAPPTIVFLGTKDKLIPVATAEKYRDKMKEAGSRCELKLYEGQGHGFFNYSKKTEYYNQTVASMDEFLVSLGYLEKK